MSDILRRQIILQCINPDKGNNKYYEINIHQYGKKKDDYTVSCRWGRIEHFQEGNPQSAVKGEGLDADDADAEVGKLLYAKLKKGYTVFKDTNQKGSTTAIKNLAQKYAVIAQPTPFERTEHVEIAPLNWWNQAEDNIEERAV